MRKIVIVITVFLINTSFFAQVTNTGEPKSWKLQNDTKSLTKYQLPKVNLEKLKKEDLVNDKLAMPWRFGFKQNINLGFKDGVWTTLENGDRIWRINIESNGAISMNVIFDEFLMPNGGEVYLYNNDRTDLLGAYTATQNQKSESLGTWLVKGSNLWIEYFEPANVKNQGKLHIGSVTHGYRNANTYKKDKSLGNSGDCNQDVDCPIGNDWEAHKDNNKKAVAILISGGSSFCSGALINNTSNDQKGYFLTANHCYSDPTNWSFMFGWISPNPVCASTADSTNGPINMSISGATLKAKNSNTDFALVEINPTIPDAWNRTWAGWDKSDANPTFEVGIHHPSGDIMKICRDNTGAIKAPNGNPVAQTWEITSDGGGWELGVTEGGSSGSPLFDQNGKIIGQLYGGLAACTGTVDNSKLDHYGRFAISWDAITGNTNQLKPWLDPNNTNQNTIDSYPPLQVFDLDAGVSVNISDIGCNEDQINPMVIIRNVGSLTLTSATINWNVDNGTDTVINWTGSLDQYEFESVPLGNITVNNTLTINATVSNPNNGNDENNTNNSGSDTISIGGYQTSQVHLELLTDDFCEETSWEFKDESGTVLYSGGPYTINQQDNTRFIENFNVNPESCYTFTIIDTATNPDGICCGFGNGSYSLTDDSNAIIFSGGSFGNSETTEIATKTINFRLFTAENIKIYPIPTKNNIIVNLGLIPGKFSYVLTNTLGQKVRQGSLQNAQNNIDISNLNNGIYFLRIDSSISKKSITKKIILSK